MAKDDRKGITIRVEPDLHAKIKIHVFKEHTNLQDYVLGLIKKDLEENYKE